MNPTSKGGFHVLLVLFKVLPRLLLRILGLGRNPNKTLGFGNKLITIKAWKFIQNFRIPCSSIPLILASPYSSPLLLLPLYLPLLLSFCSSLSLRFLYWRPILVLNPMFVKAMFGQDKKTHFLTLFSFLHLSPFILFYSQFNL